MQSLANKKTVSVISYLTIIGWFIAYNKYKNGVKSSLTKFHLEQSFGLCLVVILTNVITGLTMLIDPFFFLLWFCNNVAIIILWIAGIISAYYGVRLPLPIIGSLFENRFRFLE
ncbi:MAG TPA: DUF4870 domain-containing protein [Flavobacterium sp.]|jgi:uncharacterized membrane protein|nr:DUF4870 domain-containing protein [Flavobacterium sp.]